MSDRLVILGTVLGSLLTLLVSCQNQEIKIALGSIESNPKNFYQLPKALQEEPEIALLAIEKSPIIYQDLNLFLKEDVDFVIQAVDRNFKVYRELSDRLKRDLEILDLYKQKVLVKLKDQPVLFETLDPILYDDLEIALMAVAQDDRYYDLLSDRLKQDREILTVMKEMQKQVVDKYRKRGIEMIFIQGGTFMMGSENTHDTEKPMHQVLVKDFYISKTEVTLGQYRKCVEAGVCSRPDLCLDKNWTDSIGQKENHPVNCIDWKQARRFAKWTGGDLPSEAQWEYAARTEGKEIKYPWGNTEGNCEYAIIDFACKKSTTWEVCSKTKGNTGQGLCDMAGNVWEWVLDEWHPSYLNAPSDDIAWCSNPDCNGNAMVTRVDRGGGWQGDQLYIRTTFRGIRPSSLRSSTLGFRIVKRLN
jgi:sulfatase modifying factor 1